MFLGDESEDNSHMERASHVILYLQPETGDIHEVFFGLQPLKTTNSEAILEQAQILFKKVAVPVSKLVLYTLTMEVRMQDIILV